MEGNEEYSFFEIVKELGVHESITLEIENAYGYGDIADLFLYSLRSELYDCVFCVFDVDNKANDKLSPYNIVKSMLLSALGDEKTVDMVSICTNPNILQFFLLAADVLKNVSLTSSSKKDNSSLVHKYWPLIDSSKTNKLGQKTKSHYNASLWQLDIMKYSIINDEYSYTTLLKNAEDLPLDYSSNLPGSNLLPLLIALKEGDCIFFKSVKESLDKC